MKGKFGKKLLLYTVVLTVLTGTAAATDLQNIEKITPQGSQNINITGTIDMKGNPITDTNGDLTLDGGNVQIPDGGLTAGSNRSLVVESYSPGSDQDGIIQKSEGSINVIVDSDAGEGRGWRDFTVYSHGSTPSSATQLLDVESDGNVQIPNGNLTVSGNTDGVDLDNPGTAITVNSGQYEVTDNSISVTELDTGSTDSRYVNRGGDSMSGGLDINADSNPVLTFSDGAGEGRLIAGSTWTGIRTGDGTNALKIYQSNQNVEVPNGNIGVRASPNSDMRLAIGESDTGLRHPATDQLAFDSGGIEVLHLTNQKNVEISNGNLKMSGNNIDNVTTVNADYLDGDSGQDIQFSSNNIYLRDTQGTSTLVARDNGNVDIPNGNLDMSKNSINRILEVRYADENNDGNYFFSQEENGRWALNRDDFRNAIEVDYSGPVKLRGPASNQDVLIARNNGNLDIPNGNLDVNNQLSVGSTECNTGEYVDGDGSCTSVVGETSGQYVNEGGDDMTGNLDMNNNRIGNVSNLDVSTSSEQIASFSSTGIDFNQPVSLDSSGPLSVANGVQLTGTSSNTLESYSTLYLKTSSGSPSDIVLDPTGEVGVDSNLSVTGNIDMDSPGAIKTDGTDAISVDNNQNVEISNGNIDLNSNDLNLGNGADVTAPNSGSLRVRATGGGNNVLFDVRDTGAGQNDFLVRESGNVEIPNGNVGIGQSAGNNRLEVNGAIEASSVKNVQQVEIQSGGIPRLRFTDTDSSTAMDMDIEVQNNRLSVQNQSDSTELLNVRADSGNVKVPNGNLDINGNIEGSNKLTLTGGGAGEDAVLYTANDGSFYIENYQNGGLENAKLGLVDNNNNNVYLQARGGTIGPKNANLRLNSGYSIENGGGTEAITLDSNANVKLPNGNLIVPQGNSITDNNGNNRLEVGSSTVIKGGGSASVTVATNSVNIRGSTNSRAVILGGGGTDYMRLSNDGSQNVEIPSGNLDMKSNNINNIGTSNVDMVYDSGDDRVEMRSNGNEDICIGNCGT